ncbi:CCA tRNA nucleotidyltransferase [Thermomicrobiaceae bacterium CFH 74404]|uniref:CCA tRNA nucleotidyltransferase n=1 Tax=Thermalbibacter longus TaxID=2951981 RepID=A0AA41WG70_9BACT|nr:HD domain-containing protein [Thermalbibacter longus]MCM8749465.1 CCA tRNA nucleotidyltransferase [Thermalbibacter longus]
MSDQDQQVRATTAERDTILDRLPSPLQDITQRLAATFAAHGQELYLVGGVVRDLLLGRPVTDLDLTTSAEPPQTKQLGQEAGAEAIYTVGEAFGTIGLVFDGVTVEITTFREEHYPTPDRHPEVRYGTTLHGDLARRDFTINAIAVDVNSGEIIDPFGGREDLARRLIRAVGSPRERFAEDPLRILRAVRFAAELGFHIEPATLAAMKELAAELERISVERIAAEMNRLLVAPDAAHGLRLLHEARLLPHVLPELMPLAEDPGRGRHKNIWNHTLQVVSQAPPRLAVRWAALLHDAAKPMTRSVDELGEVHFFGHEIEGANLARRTLRRLRQDKALIERVARLVELHLRPAAYDETWTDSAVRRLMVEAGDLLEDLLDLVAADVTSARAHRRQRAARRIARLREHIRRLEEQAALAEIKSPLDGHELMAIFGLPPGRWIGELKAHLRELVIEGVIAPGDKDAALAEARRWMAEHYPPAPER